VLDQAWVAGDEVYGADPGLRSDLERRRAGYVLAVACSHRIRAWTGIEPRRRGCRWLLIRRSIATGELAFYRCYSPRPVPLTALDEHQVRRWDSWHRWTTLAMLAAAFLAITAAGHARQPPPEGQIPLTRNEIARLLATVIIQPARDAWHRLHWSAWRRRHQHRSRQCHYQRQALEP
jgi:hypothetical protein